MPEAPKNQPVRASLLSRGDFLQIIVVAAVLALGINILASAVVSGLLGTALSQSIAAGVIIVCSASYLALLALRPRHFRHQIDAVLLYDRAQDRILPVPGYELACDMDRSLSATFFENKALRAAWSEHPIHPAIDAPVVRRPNQRKFSATSAKSEKPPESKAPTYFAIVRVDTPTDSVEPKAAQILREAIEFCLIEKLSTHLSSYFGSNKQDGRFVREYTRQDVPALLLANRILSLLSTPIEDRPIFLESGIAKNPPSGEIYSIYGSDGSVFSRFDLVLPSGTSVTRPKPGTLRLESKRLTVEVTVDYQGFITNLPPAFAEVFLGVDGATLSPLQVTIMLSVVMKPWALLRIRGWEYYEWADSFVEALTDFASFPEYLGRIGWSSVLTHLRVGRPSGRKRAKSKKNRREEPGGADRQETGSPEVHDT